MDNRELKEILKNYKFFKFNKKICGEYEICKLIKDKTGQDLSIEIEDEDAFMEALERSTELVKEYPDKGDILHKLVIMDYMDSANFAELDEMNPSTKTKYRWKAIEVINNILESQKPYKKKEDTINA